MATSDEELDPVWDDLERAMGQVFMMGWEGNTVTPQIRSLIEDHHVGSFLLTTKNLKSAHETAKLVQELQTIAHQAGHPVPLLIALDQENGGVNSLFDEDYICQFPSAMGVAAAGSPELAFEVAKATATEVSAVGVNMILGPVLDVLTNARYQPLGVRATSDDPQEVSQYGIAAMNGFKEAGVTTCGKHFPSYGNLEFLGSSLDMPIITETLEQLSLGALVPFRNAIAAGLDAMFIGGVAIANAGMNVMHACLSDQVIEELLRSDLGFNGVAISECLEMEALNHDIGVRGGTVMAVEAGCDLILLCRSFSAQKEALSGLKLGVQNEMISMDRIRTSLRRVLKLKSKCTSWQQALNPPGISLLSTVQPSHAALSRKAYDRSITVMRDKGHLLPLSSTLHPSEELLLLTPLIKPLPASATTKLLNDGPRPQPSEHERWAHRSSIMSGEGMFREFGRALARQRHGKLLHTSYTANGVRPVHENLINRASAIIVVTADASRNLYQNGFTKHVAMMCSMMSASGNKKSLIVVSVSSPYDFAMDKTIGTYVCTFDFTETALAALVRALFGEYHPQGSLPGTLRKSKKVQKSRQHWLVENWNPDRDTRGLNALLEAVNKSASTTHESELSGVTASSFELSNKTIEAGHFVVRNSSTQALYGFCATYYANGIGSIGGLFVDPGKRNLSIGHSLHQRAVRSLLQKKGLTQLRLGTHLPGVYPGIPMGSMGKQLVNWFVNNGWRHRESRSLCTCIIRNISTWAPPEGLVQVIQRAALEFDLVHGAENASSVLAHVKSHSSPASASDTVEIYKLALEDAKACGVVRAKNPRTGAIIGTIIVTRTVSKVTTFLPLFADAEESTGGVISPVLTGDSAHQNLILQGLMLLGIRQIKAYKYNRCFVDAVDEEQSEQLVEMGFEVLRTFEQLTCDSSRWGA